MWPICAWEPFLPLRNINSSGVGSDKSGVQSNSMVSFWTFLDGATIAKIRLIRFVFPIGLLGALLLAISAISIFSLYRLQESMVQAVKENAASMGAGLRLEVCVRELMSTFNKYLLIGDELFLVKIKALKLKTEEVLDIVEKLAMTESEKTNVREIRAGINHFYTEYARQLEKKETFSFQLVVRKIDKILSEEIQRPSSNYIKLNEDALAQTIEKNEKMTVLVNRGILGIGFVGTFVGTVAGFLVTVSLVRAQQRTEAILRSATNTLRRGVSPATSLDKPIGTFDSDYREVARRVIAKLQKTEFDALRAEKLAYIGQMAAGVAHEIRNPLMTVKLLVQNATRGAEEIHIERSDLAIVEDEILRMEKIISGFLDFAKPDPPKPRPCMIGELLNRCVSVLKARATMQSVSIKEVYPDPDCLLMVDPDQVIQAVQNILINSLDAMPSGGYLLLSCAVKSEQNSVVIRFTDSGMGISEEIASRLFEPFTSSKNSGLGLGLSIARRIVEAHGGTLVRLISDEAHGAIFEMSFPAQ